jgi:hypothetical protein
LKEKNKEYPTYEIPVDGSLGLLALGAVGLEAWRKVRREAIRKEIKKSKELNK